MVDGGDRGQNFAERQSTFQAGKFTHFKWIVLIVVIKMLDLFDHVNRSNGHAELVVSIHSHWIGVVYECQSLVEITDVG
jgi:hypothetical protein